MKTQAFYDGYEAKAQEIREMGFDAACDKFNMEYPRGEEWTGSAEGLAYSHGEFKALSDASSSEDQSRAESGDRVIL